MNESGKSKSRLTLWFTNALRWRAANAQPANISAVASRTADLFFKKKPFRLLICWLGQAYDVSDP
jgi:hypothetical protein